jgi:renalase
MKIAIVGAGMAGLACAEALREAGLAVTLFDKGRAPGGRMSTRRMLTAAGEAGFDHGAQYFTVRDPAFRARVERWHAMGLAARWPAAGDDAWVGTPGMNAPAKRMAAALEMRCQAQVASLQLEGSLWHVEGGVFDAALVAVPAEQAAPLLRPWHPHFADRAAKTLSAPCWTVMATFADRLPIGTDILREDGIIGWAARNSAKPGRSGPESWVIQAGPDWSRANLEQDAAAVVAPLLHALSERAGARLPEPLSAVAHRWRFARSGAAGEGSLWDAGLRLGICGDWLLGPRVEAAWVSGAQLAAAVIASVCPS